MSVSNPKSKYVAYLSVLSQISNCQSLGRKNKHEILKTDRNDNNNNTNDHHHHHHHATTTTTTAATTTTTNDNHRHHNIIIMNYVNS